MHVMHRGGERNVRNVNLLVLVFVEIAFYKFFKISQTHLPGLVLLGLHLVKLGLAQPVLDMLLEPVVEECAAA